MNVKRAGRFAHGFAALLARSGMRPTVMPAPAAPLSWPRPRRESGEAALRLEDIYEAHFDFVWRTARRLGAPDLQLDDVVQEVFVVVQRRLHTFEGRSELKTWLFGITRRVVRAHLRKYPRHARKGLDDVPELPDLTTPDAEACVSAEEHTRLLHALLAELDEDKRIVFVLSELEGMTGPAIAEALDLHLSNVYARIRTARQAFDAALKRYRARTGGVR